MKKFVLFLVAIAALCFLSVAPASARNRVAAPQWYTHVNGAGKTVCDRGNNGLTGPFASREACEKSIVTPPVEPPVKPPVDPPVDPPVNPPVDPPVTPVDPPVTPDPLPLPPVEPVDVEPGQTFVCYSHSPGSSPAAVWLSDAPGLVSSGKYFVPFAVLQTSAVAKLIAVQNVIGDYVLACNVGTLKATKYTLNGTDPQVYDATYIAAFKNSWVPPINLYEIYG